MLKMSIYTVEGEMMWRVLELSQQQQRREESKADQHQEARQPGRCS